MQTRIERRMGSLEEVKFQLAEETRGGRKKINNGIATATGGCSSYI